MTADIADPTVVRIPREIWVLIAAAFVIALGFGLITPVLPQFAQSFGVGATASSIVVSVFAFFRLAFAPAGGRLIARLGDGRIVVGEGKYLAVSAGQFPQTGKRGCAARIVSEQFRRKHLHSRISSSVIPSCTRIRFDVTPSSRDAISLSLNVTG